MDNFHFDITGRNRETFELAMTLAFTDQSYAIAYKVDLERGMILYKHLPDAKESKAVTFPYQMKLKHIINFVWGWLESIGYPPPPDIDGSCERGFRIYREQTYFDENHKTFACVQPWWAIYHK